MDTTTPPTPPPVAPTSIAPPPMASATEDKTVAILSYLTLIGFIVAIVMHSNKKTQLGAFHLRQTLGFFLTVLAAFVCELVLLFIPILGWLCIFAMWVSIFVLWVMGLLSAIKGEMKPVPILGAMYQKWFGNTFN
ncbi:MAG TPA: DUF4870 domain-containing protein [Verrucomicrobiae bacterium]|nr:DUF4870 domain-containing protein [Verrucomicrobiae bacterium]